MMKENKWDCLVALEQLSRPDECCTSFAPLIEQTGLPRATVRRHVRALAREGLAEFHKGLWTDDGQPAGAGYCISRKGLEFLASGAVRAQ